jgi:ABC-type nitrate/sulfonate/bicarbonate transport system permease component
MTIEMSSKTRERLLYLISPIAFLMIWQILLMAGIGDRRFVPAPSDIARRFVTLAGTGELEWHVGVTLYRVFSATSSARCLRWRSGCSWPCSSRCASPSIR